MRVEENRTTDKPDVGHGEELTDETVQPTDTRRIGGQPIRMQPDTEGRAVPVVVAEEVVVIVVLKVGHAHGGVHGVERTKPE